jgi:hypothetical protein
MTRKTADRLFCGKAMVSIANKLIKSKNERISELKRASEAFQATLDTLGTCAGEHIYIAKELIDAELRMLRRSIGLW